MRKIKIIGVFIMFIISFLFHFIYDIFPNFIFSIIMPVNESIWEHMKLIVTPILTFSILEYIIYKRKGINYNNFILSYAISSILGIIIYLIIYIPLDYIFGHNIVIAILLLFIVFVLIQVLSYYIMNIKKIKYSNIIGIILITLLYILFGYFTYYPPNINLFYDSLAKGYGIIKSSLH